MNTKIQLGRVVTVVFHLFINSVIIFGCIQSDDDNPATDTKDQQNVDYPGLSPDIPADVDVSKINSLAEAQRQFDIHGWQTFVAVVWPVDETGKPQPTISDEGLPLWQTWKESFEVYLPDGSAPAAWESPRGVNIVCPNLADETTRVLHQSNKTSVLDEVNQAFSGPLWDQNGNEVRYEVILNKPEFDYIVTNQLYNLDGQIAFAQSNDRLNFPSGNLTTGEIGAIELKLAWKVMAEGDIQERFYTEEALIPDENGGCVKQTVGLVGMHIAHKTNSSPQWIWPTFEHVDNLQVNSLEKVGDQFLTPSFYDPTCPTCPVNATTTITTTDSSGNIMSGVHRTQVMRVIPIDEQTAELTNHVQSLLQEAGSVWQYYELVGTQWPTSPQTAPSTPGGPDTLANAPATRPTSLTIPNLGSVTNKPGGRVYPIYLTNMTMETFFQAGNQAATNLIEGNPPNNQIIFGTESCTGCHSSASFAHDMTTENGLKKPVFGGQLTGDFSWLLQQKACWINPDYTDYSCQEAPSN